MDEVLEKWYIAKEKISILEKRIEKYKSVIQKQMRQQGVNKIQGGNYTVNKRNIARNYISKDSVPPDIWFKYSVQTNSDAYYISKNKPKK